MSIFRRAERYLSGWPDSFLTVALLLAAVFVVVIALRASPLEKAAALAYVTLP